MIDLTTLRPGDTVELRCGGKLEVETCKYSERLFYINHDRGNTNYAWYSDGGHDRAAISPFDIIAIHPKPEPKVWVSYHWFDVTDGFFSSAYKDAKQAKESTIRDSDKVVRITITEGQPPKIEEA